MDFECGGKWSNCPGCGEKLSNPIPNTCLSCGFPLAKLYEELEKVEEVMLGIKDSYICFHDPWNSSEGFRLFFRLVSRDAVGDPLLKPYIRINFQSQTDDLVHAFTDDEVKGLRGLCDWACYNHPKSLFQELTISAEGMSLNIDAMKMPIGETPLTPFLENKEDFEFDRGLVIKLGGKEVEMDWNRGFSKNLSNLGQALDGYYDALKKMSANLLLDACVKKASANSVSSPWAMPVYDEASGIIKYGLYPQRHVSDSNLISALEKFRPKHNGWYFYNGCFYAAILAGSCGEGARFDDGSRIIEGEEYWFKCEPIEWVVIGEANGEYKAISKRVLLTSRFDSCSNDYANSEIRGWLNGNFYKTAFPPGETCVQNMLVDNSASTTHSPSNGFACEDTKDKITMLSYGECKRSLLLTNCPWDEIKCTDYARAQGAEKRGIVCWSRSPRIESPDLVSSVAPGLHVCVSFVDEEYQSVRPVVTIKIR